MNQDRIIECIALIIFYLIANGILASNASGIAEEKGYEKRKWFHMCFWLGLIAYLIIAAMPDKVLRENQRQTNLLLGRLLRDSPAVNRQEKSEEQEAGSPHTWLGSCDMCDRSDVRVRAVKIVDEMGTRYRNVCDQCVKKYHCTIVKG